MLGAGDPLADRQQRGELVPGPGRISRLPGPAGEVGADGEGGGMLGAQDPLPDRQQRGVLVPGPGRIPRLPGPAGEVGAGGEGVGVLGAGDPLPDGQQRGELVPGPGRDPPPAPVQRARLARTVRVSGCSAPEDPLATGSSAANWSRAPAASPASPVQRARLARAIRVSGCSAPRTRSYGQQRGVLVPGRGRIPRLPGPAGQVGAGVRVSGCSGPETRSRIGSSAANWSRAPAASPASPVQSARLARAVRVSGCSAPRVSLPGAQDLLLQVLRRGVVTALSEVPGELAMP